MFTISARPPSRTAILGREMIDTFSYVASACSATLKAIESVTPPSVRSEFDAVAEAWFGSVYVKLLMNV